MYIYIYIYIYLFKYIYSLWHDARSGREIIEIVRKYVRNIAEGNYCKHEQRKKKENEWGKEE